MKKKFKSGIATMYISRTQAVSTLSHPSTPPSPSFENKTKQITMDRHTCCSSFVGADDARWLIIYSRHSALPRAGAHLLKNISMFPCVYVLQ